MPIYNYVATSKTIIVDSRRYYCYTVVEFFIRRFYMNTAVKTPTTIEPLKETVEVAKEVKKVRKSRSDKGKKRGPYNKTKTST